MKRLDTNAVFQEFKIKKKRNKSCSSLHNRDIFFFKMLPWQISSLKSNHNSFIKGGYTLSVRLILPI